MRHFTPDAGRLCVLLAFVPAALLVPAGSPSASAVAGSLQPRAAASPAKVRLDQVGGTLARYLEVLSARTALPHAVAAEFQESDCLILNPEMPVEALRRALASAYQLTWRRDEDPLTYTLSLSSGDRQRRSTLLSRLRQRANERLRARWEAVRRMAFLGAEELRQLESGGEPIARALSHPVGSALRRLTFQLPDPVLAELWSNGSASVPVSGLSPATQKLAKSIAASSGNPSLNLDTVASEGEISLQVGGTLDRLTVGANLQYGTDGFGGNLLYLEGWARHPPEERRRENAASFSSRSPDRRLNQLVTLREPASRKRLERGERPPSAKSLAILLVELAAQVELPLVAECEFVPRRADRNGAWLNQQWWLAADIVEEPLYRALDLLCSDFEFEWRFEEGVLLLKPRLWFVPPEERGYRTPIPLPRRRPATAPPGVPGKRP